jgi:pimeloyl-ACP methyl ester carboxylesterase
MNRTYMPQLTLPGARAEYLQQGSGSGLLLLHSLLTELTVFDRVVDALAATYRVTRLNLPGFGASSPMTLVTIDEHADHVAAAMKALELPPTTAVFGNGFGAFVALALAVRHGESFCDLIVADALAAFPEAARAPFRVMAQKVRTDGMSAVLDAAISRMVPQPFALAHPDIIRLRKHALSQVDPGCFARACLALAELDFEPQLRKIRNRTLVVCGAQDHTTPAPLAQALARSIPGAAYREIPACGHCPMLEQPATLIEIVKSFLSGSSVENT